uniref:Replication factor A C-terminal domain-containing protein n=1 Tax=Setaria italica TaxID=4555 RepID=K3ZP20_SETIT
VIAMIVGVSDVTHIRVGSNSVDTPSRVIGLKDLRYVAFYVEAVHLFGQEHAVIGIFVGTLVKSYRGYEETLSSGSNWKWYLDEDIAEIDKFCERYWIIDEQVDDHHRSGQLSQRSVSELRALETWEVEAISFLCTVKVVRINNAQPWWFSSCARFFKASPPYGSEYRCSGGCASTTAIPKYRLCLICSDGTTAAKFVLFGRVAQQVVGKPVMSLMKSDGIPKEIAAIVSCFFVSFR